jgi:spoIIIJ-associated protein
MPEFEARTIKEAISKGLQALGLTQDDVVIEVMDEGRSGVFGVGSKSAVVRMTPSTAAPEPEIPAAPVIADPEPAVEDEMPMAEEVIEENLVLNISTEFLQGVLERMGLDVGIETEIVDDSPEVTYRINITGEDLGILIGRRAETLDALQYLTRLVINQHTHRWYRVELDVENYKRRSEKRLERLAHTLADQAVSEGRTFIMEAMPPRERRLIHLALRDRDDVHTESIGKGESRKVTIIPN